MKRWSLQAGPSFAAAISLALASCHGSTIVVASGALALAADGGTLTSADAGRLRLDFGDTLVGNPVGVALNAFDVAAAPLNLQAVTALAGDPEFTLDLPTGPVGSGFGDVGRVSFTPLSAGLKTATYSLKTDSQTTPTVILELQGTGVVLGLRVAPNPVDFGPVVVNQVSTQTITVTNQSLVAVPLALSPITADGGAAVFFSIDAPAAAPLAAGASAVLTAHFAPLLYEAGELQAAATVSACPGCPGVTVVLQGQALSGALLAIPAPLDFGFVQPGQNRSLVLQVKNVGNLTETVSSPTLDPGPVTPAFTAAGAATDVDGGPVTFPAPLAPGASLAIPLGFAPAQYEPYQGSLLVPFSDATGSGQSLSVSLLGFGGGALASCLPTALNFGPVVVTPGNRVTQLVECFNHGTTVPGHPEANLFLTGFSVPDGGPFGAGLTSAFPDAGLLPGESQAVAVSYAPNKLTTDLGSLVVRTNDPNGAQTVSLAGTGIAVQPCQVAVRPSAGLVFGEVLPGSRETLQFEVSNTGTTPCVLQNLNLTASSSPTFSLPRGPVASQQLSFPGDPNNPNHNPANYLVTVAAAPVDAGTETGAVSFQVVDGTPPSETVALAAQSEPGCLQISPANLDFGAVGLDTVSGKFCSIANRAVVVSNVCAAPVTLTNFTVSAGFANGPQFFVSNAPLLPLRLQAADSFTFYVSFAPSELGSPVAAVQLTTDEFPAPYLVSLLGQAIATGPRTDSFTVPPRKVDLLTVWDFSSSNFSTEVLELDVMLQYLQAAADQGVDYQVVATTTDVCPLDPAAGVSISDQGAFEPCDHCFVQADGTAAAAEVVSSLRSPQPAVDFGSLVNRMFQNAQLQTVGMDVNIATRSSYSQCAAWEAAEPGLRGFATNDPIAAGMALSQAQLRGHNAGFLRPDAKLAVLFLQGSTDFTLTMGESEVEVANLEAQLVELKGPSLSTPVCFAYAGLAGLPQPDADLVQATGGFAFTATGNVSSFQSGFASLFNTSLWPPPSFTLGTIPIRSTLVVSVDGREVPQLDGRGVVQWHYSPSTNQVVFQQSPPSGAKVTVGYQVTCP